MADLTQDRIHEIYDDFVHCRLDRFSEAFHANVDFISHAPADLFPYLGHHRGWTEVAAAIQEIHDQLKVVEFWPLSVLLHGNRSALTVFIHFKRRSDGAKVTCLAAHFLRFRENRIVEFCSILDGVDAMRQLGLRLTDDKD
jgi:SnoaL-like domain